MCRALIGTSGIAGVPDRMTYYNGNIDDDHKAVIMIPLIHRILLAEPDTQLETLLLHKETEKR